MTLLAWAVASIVVTFGAFGTFLLVIRQLAKIVRDDGEAMHDYLERRRGERADDLERLYRLPARKHRTIR